MEKRVSWPAAVGAALVLAMLLSIAIGIHPGASQLLTWANHGGMGNLINLLTASGTFLAAGVALWLGLRASRENAEAERLKSAIYGANLLPQLVEANHRLTILTATADISPIGAPEDLQTYDQASAEILLVVNLAELQFDMAVIEKLAGLPNSAAPRLAHAAGIIRKVGNDVADARAVGRGIRLATARSNNRRVRHWLDELDKARRNICAALDECRKAAAAHALPLPSQERRLP